MVADFHAQIRFHRPSSNLDLHLSARLPGLLQAKHLFLAIPGFKVHINTRTAIYGKSTSGL